MATVFFAIGTVSLLLAMHPFVTYPLSLVIATRLLGKRKMEPESDDSGSARCHLLFRL